VVQTEKDSADLGIANVGQADLSVCFAKSLCPFFVVLARYWCVSDKTIEAHGWWIHVHDRAI
jgi:hypothetical protein